MKTRIASTLPLFALSAVLLYNPAGAQDTDLDFLSDAEELVIGSAPNDTDTDGDGILDRAEVFPFQVVPGTFTFQQALDDAIAKGGRLAVIDSPKKLYEVKRGLLTAPLPAPLPNNFDPAVTLANPLWVGAHDRLVDGRYQWIAPKNVLLSPTDALNGPQIGSAAFGDLAPDSNKITNVVDINSLTLGRTVVASGIPAGTTITDINLNTRTVTLSASVEPTLSRQISDIVVTNPGFGYTTAPSVVLSGGAPGVSTTTITNGGTSYSTPPTVVFTAVGPGSGAAGVATIAAGKVTGITITNRGSGYTAPPTISFTGGGVGASGATATASLGVAPTAVASLTSDGKINAITVTNDGNTFYTAAPTVTIIGGNGGGASAVASLTPAANANLATINIDNAGSGYVSTPVVNLVGGGGSGASAVASINSAGVVTGIAIINPGSGFAFPPVVSFSGGLGVFSINVTNGGTGYATPPSVTITGGGTGATATATVSGGAVTGVTITNPGSNYTSVPTISFGGPGTGAAATATITTPAVATATIKVSSGRIYSPAPDSYSYWTGNLPGNRANSQEGVFLNSGTAFTWGTATIGTPLGYLLELPVTSPIKADTDGDGITDSLELASNPPTNPTLADTDSDGLSDSAEVTFGSNPTLADTDGDGLGDKQEQDLGTDPLLTDTDGDGLTDGQEANSTPPSNPAVEDTDGDGLTDAEEKTAGTNPTLVDTDGDNLSDGDEVGVYFTDPIKADTDSDGLTDRAEIIVHATDPLVSDSDGDGLLDGEEVTGKNGFTSNPLVIDTDGDMFSDEDEVNATPPTDPRDPRVFPSGPGSGGTGPDNLHLTPVTYVPDQTVSIDQSFTPFGQRPDIMKTCEDGASLIRDRNGVLIWTDNTGIAIRLPNASLALPLFVTSTECAVWNNRYVDYDNYDEKPEAEILLYRRDGTGTIISTTPVPLQGKSILETSPVTGTTNSFIITTIERFDNGSESVAVPAVGNPQDVDVWDGMRMRIYRLAWDGVVQRVGTFTANIPKDGDDPNIDVLGFGSDGSLVFNIRVGVDFFGGVGDANPGYWSDVKTHWITGDASIRQVQDTRPVERDPLTNEVLYGGLDPTLSADHLIAAYVSNNRTVLEEYTNLALNDYRIRSDGLFYLSANMPLPGRFIPANLYTIVGVPPYIYTTNGVELQLGRLDATLISLGAPVTLQAEIGAAPTYVRNPRDGSLLVNTENDDVGMIWVPSRQDALSGRVVGLSTPRALPNSSQGRPLFVSRTETVAWLNGGASVLPGGFIPPAQISHFHINAAGRLANTILTPPIEGNFVLNTPLACLDPDGEGWFITTFEKTAPRTALLRTYRLDRISNSDRDGDGLTDFEEINLGTDVGNPDTDGDGVQDGQEVRPYQLVTGEFTWQQARRDALAKGGLLAVLDSSTKIANMRLAVVSKIGSSSYWVGAHDLIEERTIRWITPDGRLSGPIVGKPSNWAPLQPNNQNDADGMQVGPSRNLLWSMAQATKLQGYVIQYPISDPLVADTDSDGLSDGVERAFTSDPTKKDTDGDGLSDRNEKTYRTDPRDKDSDNDGLTDGNEVNRHKTNPTRADSDSDGLDDGTEVSLGTNPLRKDTDRDGLLDGDEVKLRTNPLSPDTDGDGLSDGREVKLKTNPLKKDTDGDGVSDFDEVSKGTDPLDKLSPKGIDTDGDGLTDYEELFIYNTDPKNRDTDGDGLTDKYEVGRGTDPRLADTDGDGVNDYDEIYVLNTNPNNPSFGGPASSGNVPFGSKNVKGDYEGVVYGGSAGLSFRQKLRLAADGSFTTSLSGLRKDGSFRGKFSSKGRYAAPVGVIPGVTEVEMNVVKRAGTYVIQGSYKTRSGGRLYFELRQEGYKGARSYGWKSRLTFDASRAANARGPQGSAVATGEVRSDGKVSFKIYMPDGSRSSFTGPLLEGNIIAFYTKSSSAAPSVMLGSLSFKPVKNVSDFNGSLRLFNAGGVSGSLFPSGYDQRRVMTGSRYYKPATGTLPIGNFKVTSNNAVFNWRTGNFSGVSKVGTWTTDGRIVVPTTQNDSFQSKFDTRTGLLSVTYTRTDSSRNLNDAVAKGHAVILQKRKSFRGYYVSDRSNGDFRVEPNTDGQQPDVTTVSPLSKSVSAAAVTYTVSVTTKGTWSVVIPEDLTWVTATVSSVSGATGPSATTQGNGNGSVTITVAQNTTNTRREGNVTIAGFTHKVKQEFR